MILGLPQQITQMRGAVQPFGNPQGMRPFQPPMQGQPIQSSPLLANLASTSAQPQQITPFAGQGDGLRQMLVSRMLANRPQQSPDTGDGRGWLARMFHGDTPPMSPAAQTAAVGGGNLGGNEQGGNPGGGQPGSAGRGFGKDAADFATGLATGGIGLMGAGTLGTLAANGYLGPSFGPASQVNMDINPAAYGFNRDPGSGIASNSSPAEGFSTGDPSQGGKPAESANSPGGAAAGGGADVGAGPGGIGGAGSGSGGIGGVGGGAGDFGGVMHTGGIVPGHGNQDTIPEMMTPGEGVLTKQSVRMLRPETIALINAMAGKASGVAPAR